jgi:hypothetical protein
MIGYPRENRKMELENVTDAIDKEIARLQQVRAILVGSSSAAVARRPGRSAKKTKALEQPRGRTGKRTLSPEALERIREGQRKRWAKAKRASKAQ